MKIGVISDTHGSETAIRRAADALPDVALWLHLGDYAQDARRLARLCAKEVLAINGNNFIDPSIPMERTVQFEGVWILMTHGDRYGVGSGTARLEYRAQELGCKVALYGHTHVPSLQSAQDMLVLNPGSPFRARSGGFISVACLELLKGEYSARIYELKRD